MSVSDIEAYIASQKGLPVELWRHIFLFTRDMSKRFQLHVVLSHVCQYWREVVLSSSEIWNHVHVGDPRAADDNELLGLFINQMSQCGRLALRFSDGRTNYQLFPHSMRDNSPLIWSPYTRPTEGVDRLRLLYDLSHVDSLELEMDVCKEKKIGYYSPFPENKVLITDWPLRQLICRDIIPTLSPSTASRIRRLELTFSHELRTIQWNDILKLVHSVQVLTFDLPGPPENISSGLVGAGLCNLRLLKTTIPILRNNIVALTASSHLHRLGLYPTTNDVLVSYEEWDITLKDAQRLKNAILHFEIHDRANTSDQFKESCLNLLRNLRMARTLELEGSAINDILTTLNVERSGASTLTEMILRDGPLNGPLLLELLRGQVTSTFRSAALSVRKVVLDGCSGISQAECEELRATVGAVVVYEC
jgi:hypothetical protein